MCRSPVPSVYSINYKRKKTKKAVSIPDSQYPIHLSILSPSCACRTADRPAALPLRILDQLHSCATTLYGLYTLYLLMCDLPKPNFFRDLLVSRLGFGCRALVVVPCTRLKPYIKLIFSSVPTFSQTSPTPYTAHNNSTTHNNMLGQGAYFT